MLAAISIAIIFWIELSNLPFTPPNKATYSQNNYNKHGPGWLISRVSDAIGEIIGWIDTHHDLLLALGTITIAAFTGTLWWATIGLRNLAKTQSSDMQSLLTAAHNTAAASASQVRAIEAQERVMREQTETMASNLGVAQKAAEAAKETADLTRLSIIASQRAWLTVDVSLAKRQERITFSRTGGVLPIMINMKNIGAHPAIKVSWHAWLILQMSNALQEQHLRCNNIRRGPFGIGPTIFPQGQYPNPEEEWSFGAGISRDEIDATLRMQGSDRDLSVGGVIGCVDYTFPTDPNTHHQTGFVYILPIYQKIPEITDQTELIAVDVQTLMKGDFTLDPGVD